MLLKSQLWIHIPSMTDGTHSHSVPATKPKEPISLEEKWVQHRQGAFMPSVPLLPISIYLLYNYCIFYPSLVWNNSSNLWSGPEADERKRKDRETRSKHSCQNRWREDTVGLCAVVAGLADTFIIFLLDGGGMNAENLITGHSHQSERCY